MTFYIRGQIVQFWSDTIPSDQEVPVGEITCCNIEFAFYDRVRGQISTSPVTKEQVK